MAKPDTRRPKKPPYPVGTRLKYVGNMGRISTTKDGVTVVVQEYGLVLPVTKVREGRQGTGRLIDHDDGGEPIYDETTHGYSIVEAAPGHGRCVDPGNKDWVEV